MTTMKMNWGAKIAILYIGFVVMMVALIIASTKQKFSLVSGDYYKEEITFQDRIDATKNSNALVQNIGIEHSDNKVQINFPQEFAGKSIVGDVHFYSPLDDDYDRSFTLTLNNNTMDIDAAELLPVFYKVKINWTVNGKAYYQETDLNLNR